MKKVLCFLLMFTIAASVVPEVRAEGEKNVLDGIWDFAYFAEKDTAPHNIADIEFNEKINVPGAMETEGFGYPSYFYETRGGWGIPEDDGVRSLGAYKTKFVYTGKGYLVFESFKDSLTVYINGKKTGESRMGTLGCEFEFTGKGENELVCLVERNKTGINKEDNFALSGIMGNVYVTDKLQRSSKADTEVIAGDNRLTVNGKDVIVKGVYYTPTHPQTGDAITKEQIEKDLLCILDMGFNTVLVSGAPEYFYEEAQRLGLYIADEGNIDLSSSGRDGYARDRIVRMIEKHGKYKNIIMWSAGHGEGEWTNLAREIKKLDGRPVMQEVNLAPAFKVFGNTGGIKKWAESLGENNAGGFVYEFADKELYFTKNVYVFDVKDDINGDVITADGEIKNYRGTNMLGRAGYVRNVEDMDRFTVSIGISGSMGERVLFETEDGGVKIETTEGGVAVTADGRTMYYNGDVKQVAAVYADGEMQLYADGRFRDNMKCGAKLTNSYSVGDGDGKTAIEFVKIYNDALTLDELLAGKDDKAVSLVQFKEIDIKEDKSYKFLAYGGDFGDEINSYYKCLTGLLTSLREPHPEAWAFKEAFGDKKQSIDVNNSYKTIGKDLIEPVIDENSAVFDNGRVKITVDFEGRITSAAENGRERLAGFMYPSTAREETIREMEEGDWYEEGWKYLNHEIKDGTLYVELTSTVTDARLNIAYSMNLDGVMIVSVQARYAEDGDEPSFVGFRGKMNCGKVSWIGRGEGSSYPDRRYESGDDCNRFEKNIGEMTDNYGVPQENGNRCAYKVIFGENGDKLCFAPLSNCDMLEFAVHDYDPWAIYDADHDEDIEREEAAYFRVGGYIKGISGEREYDLTQGEYGYSFCITTEEDPELLKTDVREVLIDGKKYAAFNAHEKNYVYAVYEEPKVEADGEDVAVQDNKAVFGDYTIYFTPKAKYLSDMTQENDNVRCDRYFDGSPITVRGNDYRGGGEAYDKGVAIKGGCELVYDVSDLQNYKFSAVVGKQELDWRKMTGGFNPGMFDAECDIAFYLDGAEAARVAGVSMMSGSKKVEFDISEGKELKIIVKGGNKAPDFEDAVIANGVFVPKGPVIINFEKTDRGAEITVLNTDREQVDVVLTATENGVVRTKVTAVLKGLYKTLKLENTGEDAFVKAYVTGLGEVICE